LAASQPNSELHLHIRERFLEANYRISTIERIHGESDGDEPVKSNISITVITFTFLYTVVVANRAGRQGRIGLWLNDRSTWGYPFEKPTKKKEKGKVSRKEARKIKQNKQMGVLFV
jgi:hypothetical protein